MQCHLMDESNDFLTAVPQPQHHHVLHNDNIYAIVKVQQKWFTCTVTMIVASDDNMSSIISNNVCLVSAVLLTA